MNKKSETTYSDIFLTIAERQKICKPLYDMDFLSVWKEIKKELYVTGFNPYLIQDMTRILRLKYRGIKQQY